VESADFWETRTAMAAVRVRKPRTAAIIHRFTFVVRLWTLISGRPVLFLSMDMKSPTAKSGLGPEYSAGGRGHKKAAGLRQRHGATASYFFLFAAALALVACWEVIKSCFLLVTTLARDCFWEACFCTYFGDLSPMVGVPLNEGWLTVGMFVSPKAWLVIREGGSKVNNRRRRDRRIAPIG
jgi:hypothetical protein